MTPLLVILKREDMPDRLNITVTIMLIQVAYKVILVDQLPRIDYLTLLDKYLLLCLAICVMVLATHVR